MSLYLLQEPEELCSHFWIWVFGKAQGWCQKAPSQLRFSLTFAPTKENIPKGDLGFFVLFLVRRTRNVDGVSKIWALKICPCDIQSR
ncbi:hypothetical protein TorRG33x02_058310 [Trema orientale]|uniref:Uncharacterized protein n=1 Tax=Trema orientale TaxID=63057 RepID=A0A2P5FKG7_TREOI|nr:hypothetical protein TorRG33x02_058310 [Trema orientale]